jgi:hypothetical protein
MMELEAFALVLMLLETPAPWRVLDAQATSRAYPSRQRSLNV